MSLKCKCVPYGRTTALAGQHLCCCIRKKTKSPREVVSLHFLDYRKQKEIETQREEIIERDSWNTAGYMISIGQCVGNSKNKQTRIICDSKERNLLDKSEEFHSQVI